MQRRQLQKHGQSTTASPSTQKSCLNRPPYGTLWMSSWKTSILSSNVITWSHRHIPTWTTLSTVRWRAHPSWWHKHSNSSQKKRPRKGWSSQTAKTSQLQNCSNMQMEKIKMDKIQISAKSGWLKQRREHSYCCQRYAKCTLTYRRYSYHLTTPTEPSLPSRPQVTSFTRKYLMLSSADWIGAVSEAKQATKQEWQRIRLKTCSSIMCKALTFQTSRTEITLRNQSSSGSKNWIYLSRWSTEWRNC